MAVIDIGPGAIDGLYVSGGNYTQIQVDNPANDTGKITSIEVWFNTNSTATRIGTFSGSGTSYTNRDSELIGNVTAGSKQIFSGLDCAVVTGDLLGGYWGGGGNIDDIITGGGNYYKAGDQFGTGEQTYTFQALETQSIYGTGTTVVVYELSCTDGLKAGDAPGITKTINLEVSDGLKGSDASANIANMYNALTDGVKLSDLTEMLNQIYKSLTDGVKTSDSSLTQVILNALATDGTKLSETLSTWLQTYPIATDGVKLSETLATLKETYPTATDGAKLSDSTSMLNQIYKSLTDGVTLSDATLHFLTLSLLATDGVKLSDAAILDRLKVIYALLKLYARAIISDLNQRSLIVKMKGK